MPLTMRTAWEHHYRPFIAPSSAPQTLRAYESTVRAWERLGSRRTLDCLSATDFIEFCSQALAEGKRHATVNHYLRELRAIISFAVSEGLLHRMPRIRPVREPERQAWRPTTEEVGKIYSSVRRVALEWPFGPAGFAHDWWESFIVWSFVGALRLSEVMRVNDQHCTDDGIELHAPKTERLSFVPGLSAVRRQMETMQRWWSGGLQHPAYQSRRVYSSVDLIGGAAGIRWRPHDLKRSSIDAWSDVSETCAIIIGHGRKSTAVKNYLDRKRFILKRAGRLELPRQFSR